MTKEKLYYDVDYLADFAVTVGIDGAAAAEKYGMDKDSAWRLVPDLKREALADAVARYLEAHDMVEVYHAWINGPEVNEE